MLDNNTIPVMGRDFKNNSNDSIHLQKLQYLPYRNSSSATLSI
jgi:hypothetical protein